MLYSRQSMDRGLRIMGGCVLTALALMSGTAIGPTARCVALAIGAYALVSGLFNVCPLCRMISREKQHARRRQAAAKELAVSDVKELGFFVGLTDKEIAAVLGLCHLKEYPSDQEAVAEGRHKKALCIIYSGQFKIVKRIAENETKLIATIADGDTFGELSFFDSAPPGVSIISMQESKVLEIDEGGFAELTGKDPHLGVKVLSRLMRTTSARVRAMNEQIASLGSWLVQKRSTRT